MFWGRGGVSGGAYAKKGTGVFLSPEWSYHEQRRHVGNTDLGPHPRPTDENLHCHKTPGASKLCTWSVRSTGLLSPFPASLRWYWLPGFVHNVHTSLMLKLAIKIPPGGEVNTFCSSHSPCSLGKTLNVLPPKCPESCGLLQMKVQGGGQPLILPPLQSPFQDQSCCVCSPVSHNKSFPRGEGGTTERFTTELFKFCWKRMTVISHSCSATTPAFISRLYWVI